MRQNILLLTSVAIAVTSLSSAADAEPNYRKRNKYRPHLTHSRTTFDLDAGVRIDDFDWNIASEPTGTATPNILSELTWENIHVLEVKGHLRHLQPASNRLFRGNIMLDAEATGGFTISGDNQDSDYAGDDRTGEFSRSNNDSGSGFALGGSVSAGYQFKVAQKIRPDSQTYFTLAPLVGYAWDRQKYKMRDGFQTIPAVGAFGGLDFYMADWYGPFAGLEAGLEHNRHMLTVRGEKHYLTYSAEADWNLRDDFMHNPSYTHEAEDGDGAKINVGYNYAIDSRYDFTFDYDFVTRKVEDGVDTTFFSDGTTATTRLNEVNDRSHAFRAGITYYFDPPKKSLIPKKQDKK